jgi:hypothetical protein
MTTGLSTLPARCGTLLHGLSCLGAQNLYTLSCRICVPLVGLQKTPCTCNVLGSTGWRRYVAQKRLIQIGLVLIGIGVLLLTQRTAPDLTISEMILPMAVVGVGLGLFTGQLVDLTMSAVPEAFSEVSSGVINSLSQLGYAFGTAVAGSVQLGIFYGSVVDGVTLWERELK